MNSDEIHFDLLRRLERKLQCSQRERSKEMGVSLWKINYCVNKAYCKGFRKVKEF